MRLWYLIACSVFMFPMSAMRRQILPEGGIPVEKIIARVLIQGDPLPFMNKVYPYLYDEIDRYYMKNQWHSLVQSYEENKAFPFTYLYDLAALKAMEAGKKEQERIYRQRFFQGMFSIGAFLLNAATISLIIL